MKEKIERGREGRKGGRWGEGGREERNRKKINQIYPHDLFQLSARPGTLKGILVFAIGEIVDF